MDGSADGAVALGVGRSAGNWVVRLYWVSRMLVRMAIYGRIAASESLMSLVFVLVLWAVLGGSVLRARRRARSLREHGAPGVADAELGHRPQPVDIPETVPSEWVEDYRSEHGG